MAHRKSCDACPSTTDEEYPSGWGRFWGFDPEKMTHGSKDLCPRCSLVVTATLVDLRKRNMAPPVVESTGQEKPAAAPPPDPNSPGNIGRLPPFIAPKRTP